MKEIYTAPESCIIGFDNGHVITNSITADGTFGDYNGGEIHIP